MTKPSFDFLTGTDSAYPAALRHLFGQLAPPDLWYAGNLDLLRNESVGFCGSRKASEQGLAVAADCAAQLSEVGVTVVSGYAPGVDTTSHVAALAHGGTTIAVLPEGHSHFRIKRSLKDLWDWDRVLILSYFGPDAVWRADRAMDRNKVIVALSHAVIVVEAGDTGGTLNAGFTALKAKKPLFVVSYSAPGSTATGNDQLIRDGGVPVLKRRTTGRAHIERIVNAVKSRAISTP